MQRFKKTFSASEPRDFLTQTPTRIYFLIRVTEVFFGTIREESLRPLTFRFLI